MVQGQCGQRAEPCGRVNSGSRTAPQPGKSCVMCVAAQQRPIEASTANHSAVCQCCARRCGDSVAARPAVSREIRRDQRHPVREQRATLTMHQGTRAGPPRMSSCTDRGRRRRPRHACARELSGWPRRRADGGAAARIDVLQIKLTLSVLLCLLVLFLFMCGYVVDCP